MKSFVNDPFEHIEASSFVSLQQMFADHQSRVSIGRSSLVAWWNGQAYVDRRNQPARTLCILWRSISVTASLSLSLAFFPYFTCISQCNCDIDILKSKTYYRVDDSNRFFYWKSSNSRRKIRFLKSFKIKR